ncbi:MAG TPA: branched-chain amino acid ABC transporter permease, partial [Mycobacteriales bacterium]|nr:branched-chain amino acid ABC transporter permease [Mycobacteriales bacterium]
DRPEAAEEVRPGPSSVEAAGPRTGLRRFWPSSTLAQHALLMLLAFVGIVVLVETLSPFRVTQLAAMAYFVPAVAGLTVLTGISGQISLGHGAFMAIGGYTTALLLDNYELPFLLIVLIAVALTALVGVAVGAAASRLHGPYLAGATLAFAVGLPGIAQYRAEELGGDQGLLVSAPEPPAWLEDVAFFITGNELTRSKYVAYLGWFLALVVLLLLSNLVKSGVGRRWRAVRDDEVAAELSGVNLGRWRVLAFVVSAGCAGVGGALLAIVTGLVSPGSFGVFLSIFLLVGIVVGGLGSLLGAVIGSALLVFFIDSLTDLGHTLGLSTSQAANTAPLAFGVFLIVIMLIAPQGIVGTIRVAWLKRKAARAAAGSGR